MNENSPQIVHCFGVVLVCYLLITLPMVSATNIKLIYGGSTVDSIEYNPSNFVKITSDVYDDEEPKLWRDEYIKVGLNVKNATGDVRIVKGYVYPCKNMNPSECITDAVPETFAETFEKTYNWVDIRNKDAYPQPSSDNPEISRFLVLAKVSKAGRLFWTGLIFEIRRVDYNLFSSYSLDATDTEIYINDYSYVSIVSDFIRNNFIIPFNTQWIDRIVFYGAECIFSIMGTPENIISAQENESTEITFVPDMLFVFSNATQGFYSAVVINHTEPSTCGFNGCEPGETSDNCCIDCGCLSGYYCDIGYGYCRSENEIHMSLYGMPQTELMNCYIAHKINVSVIINNPPSDMTVSAWKAVLNGEEQEISCSNVFGSVYSCTVTVPALPNCGEGEFVLTSNYIENEIAYSDGSVQKTKRLLVSLPDITISSYTCGDGKCEDNKGEDLGRCCYDCGCAGGYYCDVRITNNLPDPKSGTCKIKPRDSDIEIFMNQTIFYSGSFQVGAEISVNNPPRSLELLDLGCGSGCDQDGHACMASCDITCNRFSYSGDVYEGVCVMNFFIENYTKTFSYTLHPVINLTLKYYDGPNAVEESLSLHTGSLSIPMHFCGDRECNGDENQQTCCYDCGCPAGMYCDTKDRDKPMEGDRCRNLNDVNLVIDSIEPRNFSDAAEQNVINISAHIINPPSSLKVTPSCEIGGGNVSCNIACERLSSSTGDYNLSCSLYIEPLDYRDPKVANFYDAVDQKLVLEGNRIELSLRFNDGGSVKEIVREADIGRIEMDVVWHCGVDVYGDGILCEADLGENSENCCIDCGCGNETDEKGLPLKFCYTGKSLHGECIERSLIGVNILSVNPETVKCVIPIEKMDTCLISQAVEVNIEIVNEPDDFSLLYPDSFWKIEGVECVEGGENCPLICYKIGEGNYTCSLVIPSLPLSSPQTINKDLYLHIVGAHSVNGVYITEELDATGNITFDIEYSPELKTCMDQKESLERSIEKYESIISELKLFLGVVWAVVAWLWTMCVVCCSSHSPCSCDNWCGYAKTGTLIGTCVSGPVLSVLGMADGKLNELKMNKYKLMCTAANPTEAANMMVDTSGIWMKVVGAVASIACFFSGGISNVFSKIFGSGESVIGKGKPIFSDFPYIV